MSTSRAWATPSSARAARRRTPGCSPLKGLLYERGTAPVLAARAALTPQTDEAAAVVRAAIGYVTNQAARLDYPRFVARQFPIGSGAAVAVLLNVIRSTPHFSWHGALGSGTHLILMGAPFNGRRSCS